MSEAHLSRVDGQLSPALLGSLAMLGAVSIYGTNFAISRFAIQSGLTAWDLVALRFLVAGLMLLPVFLARGGLRTCAGVGWRRGVVLCALSGFPLSILMLTGVSLAPASHGATIGPGTVTVIGAVGSFLMFGVRLASVQIAGLALVLVGLAVIAVAGASSPDPSVWRGDLLFLATGLIWGTYPLILQRWKLDALTSTAVVAVLSLVFVPFYLVALDPQLSRVGLVPLAFHAFNQGVLNVVVGLWLWAKAVDLMGAGPAGRFPPLIPVIGTLAAIPLLGELPSWLQLTGIACIVGGLLVVSTARRPAPAQTRAG
jgi:drug/metabolite transporter (DMT)-like permease